METVTLYKVVCLKGYQMAEQGEGFSLEPWGEDTEYYEGEDDGGKEYLLPDGYTLSETKYGERAIFDSDMSYCHILVHSCGRPQLSSGSHKSPVLKEYVKEEM